MIRSLLIALPAAALAAGCATSPAPEAGSAETTHKVQLAAASLEIAAPATLPFEPELSRPNPVDVYVQVALERNPQILAAQRRVAAEAEVIPQRTALEDPMLQDTFRPDPDHSPQTAAGRMPNTLMLTQRFPWLAKLRVRGEVAEQETKIALADLAQSQLEVIENVHLAYYEIYYFQRAIEITLESEDLLQDLVEFARARFAAGASAQDVLRAQLELDRLREQLVALRRQLRVRQADLASLLHASPEIQPNALARLDLPPIPAAIDLLYEAAVRCRPELQERLHAIVRDERQRELARLQYYPDVTLGVSWDLLTTDQALAGMANGNDNFGVTVGVNLPIWRDRLRAGVREAEHRLVASARQYDATRDDTFRQVRRLIAQIDAFEEQLRMFRDVIIPRAEQTLEVSVSDYSVGKVDILQVIDNWTELLRFEIQLARLEANLGQALASLERVVGCQLASLPGAVGAAAAPVPQVPVPPAPANGGPDRERGLYGPKEELPLMKVPPM